MTCHHFLISVRPTVFVSCLIALRRSCQYSLFTFPTVKDYQLMQVDESLALSSHYLKNFISIVNQLLQAGVESSSSDAVEATWVLSLALKGLYSILKVTQAYYLGCRLKPEACADITGAGTPVCDCD